MGLEKCPAFWNSLPTWIVGLKVRILSPFVVRRLNVEQSKISPAGKGVQDKIRHHEIQLLVDKNRSVEDERGDVQTLQRVSGQCQGRCRLEMVTGGCSKGKWR